MKIVGYSLLTLSGLLFAAGVVGVPVLSVIMLVYGIIEIVQMVSEDSMTFGSVLKVALLLGLRSIAGFVLAVILWGLGVFGWSWGKELVDN